MVGEGPNMRNAAAPEIPQAPASRKFRRETVSAAMNFLIKDMHYSSC